MKLQIPLGSEINQTDNNLIKIRVPNTKYWVEGEKIKPNLWNIYLTEPGTKLKDIIKEEINTKAFIIFTNTTLKTPFPDTGKRATTLYNIKKFLKQI